MPGLTLALLAVALTLTLAACSSGPTEEEIRAMVRTEVAAAVAEVKQGPPGTSTLESADAARLELLEVQARTFVVNAHEVRRLPSLSETWLSLEELNDCLNELEDAVDDIARKLRLDLGFFGTPRISCSNVIED